MAVLVLIALGVLCIINVFFFVYKWYDVYSKNSKNSFWDIIGNGKYRPKYINPQDSPFGKEVTSSLNRLVAFMHTSMILAFVVALIAILLLSPPN